MRSKGWLVVLFLLFWTLPMTARADDGLQYELSSDGESVAVTGYTGNGPEVTIPDTMWNRPVTVIRKGAFTSNEKIQEIHFGKNVKIIEEYSCNRMKNLASLRIPGNVIKIGMSAFCECRNLRELAFEEGMSVLTLVCYSFTDCPKLREINFGTRPIKGVSRDGIMGGTGNLFSGSAISEITIPATVDISEMFSALEGCDYLRKVTIDAKSIKSYTFSNGGSLEEVILRGTVTIEKSVFSRCTSLTAVTFPDTLQTIGEGAFDGCAALARVELPESVEEIGGSAFRGCTAFKEFTFPAKVKAAQGRCLEGCTGLETVTFPEGLESIGARALSGCTALKSIRIPAQVKEIAERAFEGCEGLEQITVAEDNPAFLARENLLYDKAQTTLLRAAQRAEKISLADTTASIGAYACTGMQSVKSFAVPQQITEIGTGAFADSLSLEELSFAEGEETLSLGGYAFENCTGLLRVDFGTRQIRVENSFAFRNTGLLAVRLTENVNTEKGSAMFQRCEKLERVEITGEQKGASLFTNCAGLTTAVLTQMTAVPNALFSESGALSDVSLGEGIETIGKRAFWKTGLGTVGFPDSLKRIEDGAFGYCSLTGLHIPAGVEYIGLQSLEGCQKLAEITVDQENSFYAAENNILFDKTKETLLYLPGDGYGLANISIPESVKKVSTRAFSNCGELEWAAFDGGIPAGVYEPSDGWGLADTGFSLGKVPTDSFLFYGEEYPAWQTTGAVKIPAQNRVPITQEMREIREVLESVGPENVKPEDKEELENLRQRYQERGQDEKLWIGSDEKLEAAYARASGLAVKLLIQALPEEEELTAADREAVEQAERAYEQLGGTAKAAVGDTLMLRLRKAALRMQEILKVKEIRPSLKEMEGMRGETIEISVEILPDYAKNRTLLCELEDLELADYTIDQDKKTIAFSLKKEGSTAAVLLAADESGVSVRIPLKIRLPQPRGTEAKQHGATAEVKWQKVEGASGYRIYCSVNGGEFRECGSTPNIIFVHDGLQPGNTYSYCVAAVSGDGHDSPLSSDAAVLEIPASETEKPEPETEKPEPETEKPEPETEKLESEKPLDGKEEETEPPGEDKKEPEDLFSKDAPQKVKAVSSRKQTVRLTWKKVSGASGYQIFRSTAKKGRYQRIRTLKKGRVVRYNDRKLKKRTYYYKIRAFLKQEGKETVYGKWSKAVKVKVKK